MELSLLVRSLYLIILIITDISISLYIYRVFIHKKVRDRGNSYKQYQDFKAWLGCN